MPKFIIEREMAGVGAASAQDMRGAAKTSCDVLRATGPDIQWVESYVQIALFSRPAAAASTIRARRAMD
ncbi:nickel-binding protein [Sabulicella glaciei]|uniref:nickel-binding protein n=1 Tax=Sabulicella glaciei TaxID=2984948 RepID=UPI0034A081E8